MLTLQIEQDWDAENPREFFDHYETIYYTSNRYVIGDKQITYDDWINILVDDENLLDYYNSGESKEKIDTAISAYVDKRILNGDYIYMPVYAYIHSGITVQAGVPYGDIWDSGQSGWVFLDRKGAKEYGFDLSIEDDRTKAYDMLRGAVKEYDQFLTGDVWYFCVKDENDEIVDDCGDFYGYESCEEDGNIALQYFQNKKELESIDSMHELIQSC